MEPRPAGQGRRKGLGGVRTGEQSRAEEASSVAETPDHATSSLVFTPSTCTSDVLSYWFDFDLQINPHIAISAPPNLTMK